MASPNWHDYFTYDERTGGLTHKERPRSMFPVQKMGDAHKVWNKRFAGKAAGLLSETKGYVYVSVNGRRYSAHRVIWEMRYGPIPPKMQIDHINRVRSDNRIENLRQCSGYQNRQNEGVRSSNACGIKGVVYYKRYRKWLTRIVANGTLHLLGRYETKGEAAVVYAKASLRYHGKFSPYYKPKEPVPCFN